MSLLPRDVIQQAMVHLGVLESAGTPGPDELTDALVALNAMQRAMFGTVIGVRLSAQAASGVAWQAENGGEYAIPGGAEFTLTAPLNPRAGARFGVVDASGDFTANPCTINPNGRQINGAAAPLVLATSGVGGRWWYRPDTGGWVLEGDWTAPTTPIPFSDSLIAYLPFMLAVILAAQYGQDIPQSVVAAAVEGRSAFARAYARRGRNQIDPSFGIMAQQPASQPQQGAR
jgi:hypothetical protein